MIRHLTMALGFLCFAGVMSTGCLAASETASEDQSADTGDGEDTDTNTEALTWKPGWHYITWGAAGVRPWNPSSCGGTVTCTLHAGDAVYWYGGGVAGCGGNSGDAYIHHSKCGNGWVRQDAIN